MGDVRRVFGTQKTKILPSDVKLGDRIEIRVSVADTETGFVKPDDKFYWIGLVVVTTTDGIINARIDEPNDVQCGHAASVWFPKVEVSEPLNLSWTHEKSNDTAFGIQSVNEILLIPFKAAKTG